MHKIVFSAVVPTKEEDMGLVKDFRLQVRQKGIIRAFASGSRKAMRRALGLDKQESLQIFYKHEFDLFEHTRIPRPWLNIEGDLPLMKPEQVDALEFDLRRYVHAIDKGMQLPERRIGFGKEKIKCALRMLSCLQHNFPTHLGPIKQALDVLRRYEDILQKDIESSNGKSENTESIAWLNELKAELKRFEGIECSIPAAHQDDKLSPVFFQRRSIRRWSTREVDHDTLLQLIEAAVWAPASCNRQPTRFLFVRDSFKKQLLVDTATGARGFAELAPVMLVLLNDVRAYCSPWERHLAYIDSSLAAQNFTLAAHEVGLGTVWLNWALDDPNKEEAVRHHLAIPPWCAIIALIAVGYPDETLSCLPSARRSAADIIDIDCCRDLSGLYGSREDQ